MNLKTQPKKLSERQHTGEKKKTRKQNKKSTAPVTHRTVSSSAHNWSFRKGAKGGQKKYLEKEVKKKKSSKLIKTINRKFNEFHKEET